MVKLYEYLSEKYKTDEIGEIEKRLLELSSLFEISQLLNASLELSQILNIILYIPMGRLMISRGLVFLKQNDNNKFEIVATKGIKLTYPTPTFFIKPFDEDILFVDEVEEPASIDTASDVISFARENHFKIIIPLKSSNHFLGGVAFGDKLTRTPFSEEEKNFLISLMSIASTSVENALQIEKIKEINLQLDQKIQQLRTLFDISRGLTTTFEEEQILKLFGLAVMGQMLINRFALYINRDGNFQLQQSHNLSSSLPKILKEHREYLLTLKNPVRVAQLTDTRLASKLQQEGVSLILPLNHQQKNIGLAFMGSKLESHEFSDADLEFLSTLSGQTVIAVENARLFKETLEKQRLEDELKVARQIQAKLLPHKLPEIENYEIYGFNLSSKEVGGDYYDVIYQKGDRLVLAIGDVSGKSVPAALLMANLQAALRTLIRDDIPISKIVSRLNELIYENTDADKFITFFIGILDLKTHQFNYVNAGHNAPFLILPDKQILFLKKGGIILGVLPDQQYEMGTVVLPPGALLIGYTDGVNEALNIDDEEFGEERLIQLAQAQFQLPVQTLCNKIVETIQTFSQGMPQTDDITLIALRRKR